MRDLREALSEFWGGFESKGHPVPAFVRGYVVFRDKTGRIKKSPAFPYITYEVARPGFGDFTVCTASILDRNIDNPGFMGLVDDILAQIAEKIPESGALLDVEGGFIKLSRANPFIDYVDDPDIRVVKGVVRYVVRSYLC